MRVPVDSIASSAFTVPTPEPESDGTFEWDATTLVLVEASAGGETGIGYSYTDPSAASLIRDTIGPLLVGVDALAVGESWSLGLEAVRNIGSGGLVASARSAVDTALWDLKARLLGVSLADLLGPVRPSARLYGSGGFTSLSMSRLQDQLAGWAEQGFTAVKMKVGREPSADLERVAAAREAIGPGVDLYVDANGAYTRKQALLMAEGFAEQSVVWFEEPVSSDDLEGLRLLRDRAPAGMAVAAGEYGFESAGLQRLLQAGAVDVLQADVTRCEGMTGFLTADALCWAHRVPLSAHTAPALHLPLGVSCRRLASLEWFADHVRVERMLFDGFQEPDQGRLSPDRDRPGLGLELKRSEAERFADT